MNYLYVIAGAVAGAPLRYFVGSRLSPTSGFPWATLAVNASGCLLIGFILGLAEQRGGISREARLLLVTGFLGSYTTFSAFGWEAYSLSHANELGRAIAYVMASVALGLMAVVIGAQAARLG